MEYGFDTDPLSGASGPPVIDYTLSGTLFTKHGSPTVAVTFPTPSTVDYSAVFGRRLDYVAAGLTYTVQFSHDLSFWYTSPATPVQIATETGAGATLEAVKVPYPLFINPPSGGPRKPQYFRVVVSTP